MEVAIWMKTNWKVFKRLMIMSLSSTMHIVSKLEFRQIGELRLRFLEEITIFGVNRPRISRHMRLYREDIDNIVRCPFIPPRTRVRIEAKRIPNISYNEI